MGSRTPVGLRSRVSRRKVFGLAATAGAGVAAVGLVGCGGGDEGGGDGSGDSASILHKPVDTTSSAKPGGVYENSVTNDPTNWDYLGATGNSDRNQSAYVYSRLFKWKPGIGAEAEGVIEGDLAASFEFTTDLQQLTVKLRPNAKWDARAPTNGRALDSSDVKFSFDRMKTISLYRNDWFNDLNPSGPIQSVTTPDSSTVVVKLAFPLAAVFEYFGNSLGFFVMPKEADGGFDPRSEPRGTGPWFLDKHETAVAINFKKNPNWYVKDRPLLDGWTNNIVKEYAQQLAQFRTGNLWGGGFIRQEDILQTKKDLPQLLMTQNEYSSLAPGVFFGWSSPQYKDERVRRAMSMLVDRETFAQSFSDQAKFAAEGIDVGLEYDNFLGRGWGDYWLDPYGKDAGPDAGLFKFDIAEAKKLMTAAGYANGFSTEMFAPSGLAYGQTYVNYQQTLGGMFNEGGIKVTFKEVGYSNDYVPNYNYNQAFDGLSVFLNTVYGGVANNFRSNWHSNSAQDRSPYAPTKINKPAAGPRDTQLDGLIEKLLREPDHEKGVAVSHDIQRYLTKVMYTIPFSYKTRSLSLAHPWVGNTGVYNAWVSSVTPTDTLPYLWYDASKKTA